MMSLPRSIVRGRKIVRMFQNPKEKKECRRFIRTVGKRNLRRECNLADADMDEADNHRIEKEVFDDWKLW